MLNMYGKRLECIHIKENYQLFTQSVTYIPSKIKYKIIT